ALALSDETKRSRTGRTCVLECVQLAAALAFSDETKKSRNPRKTKRRPAEQRGFALQPKRRQAARTPKRESAKQRPSGFHRSRMSNSATWVPPKPSQPKKRSSEKRNANTAASLNSRTTGRSKVRPSRTDSGFSRIAAGLRRLGGGRRRHKPIGPPA